MRAAIVEGPEKLVVRDVPEPTMGDYQARCEILFGATCSGTDSHIVRGEFPYLSPLPTILGHESIARVTDVGAKVRNLKVGDLVTRVGTTPVGECSVTWGGFAEIGVATDFRAAEADGVPPDTWWGARVNQVLPADADPAAATMVITWRETTSYANRIGIPDAEAVLVVGSGGNGLSYAAHAASAGCERVVMIGSPVRQPNARQVGVTAFLDYRDAGVADAARELAPDGFDVAIDAVGRQDATDLALSLLAAGGTLGIYGIDEFGRLRLNPDAPRGTFTVFKGGYDEAETHEQVVARFMSGDLDASAWLDLDNPFDLADIRAAIDATRQRRLVKALVRIRG